MATNSVSYLHQLASQRDLKMPEFTQVLFYSCLKNYKMCLPTITVCQNCHLKSGFFANVLVLNQSRGHEIKHWQNISVHPKHGNGNNSYVSVCMKKWCKHLYLSLSNLILDFFVKGVKLCFSIGPNPRNWKKFNMMKFGWSKTRYQNRFQNNDSILFLEIGNIFNTRKSTKW